jgi:hypothetical protein
MRLAILRRSLAAAAAITLLVAPSAFAESVTADGDDIQIGFQTSIDVGTVAPGEDVPWYVYYVVTCSGTNHVDPGQSIRLSPGTRLVPSGAGFSVGTLTFQLPSSWPVDGAECPTDLQPFVAGPLYIVLTAPTVEGTDYHFRFSWNRAVTPSSTSDSGVFSGTNPTIEFFMDVVAPPTNTPPTLDLPADSMVEGDTTGGASAAYTVGAGDAEDATAPTPACSPAVGDLLPLGPNTISCSVTDEGGLSATGSFTITVVDTTAPAIAGMPADKSLTTTGSNATLTYAMPAAIDLVDPAPTVGCVPGSGSSLPIGNTTVTCTASDSSGNSSSASFTAHVTRETPPPPPADPVFAAIWEQPVGGSGAVTVNDSRTLPIKVRLLEDGSPVTHGTASLRLSPCAGGNAVRTVALGSQSNGRWTGHLDTSGLGNGCFRAVVSVGGQAFGSFTLNVAGQSAPTNGTKPKDPHGHGKPPGKGHDSATGHGGPKGHDSARGPADPHGHGGGKTCKPGTKAGSGKH